jgi:MarR family transcriptional regulator, organic hydroperoxide resistance regulator
MIVNPGPMIAVDEIVRVRMIVRVTRSMTQTVASTVATEALITDVRSFLGELKCVGSERLLRMGISMAQLHVLHLLERHGELAMSRLAETLDVSFSAATGLVDRIEERGFVERIRVPSDRRVVLVRITAGGRRLLEDVEVLQTEFLSRVLDQLDPDQLDGVGRAMADLRAALAATPIHGGHHHIYAQGRE